MIRTILIDDESLARDIVKHYLSSFPDIEVVAECSDGFEGLKAITQHHQILTRCWCIGIRLFSTVQYLCTHSGTTFYGGNV